MPHVRRQRVFYLTLACSASHFPSCQSIVGHAEVAFCNSLAAPVGFAELPCYTSERGSELSVHHPLIKERDEVMLTELMEVILYVQDMQDQVAFYRDKLGLCIKEPQQVEDYSTVFWVELDTGACTLVLHGGGQKHMGIDAPKVVFRVSEIEQARRALVKRDIPLGEIRSPAPGVLVCDGTDPEGNKFSIESR